MKEFDVYANKDTNNTFPYFVDVQSHLLDSLNDRVVIPLTAAFKSATHYPHHLRPSIRIKNNTVSWLTHPLTSAPFNFLEKSGGSQQSNRDAIVATIDVLVTGI